MKRDSNDQRIALFIDFENLVTRTGIDADKFDLQPAVDALLSKGKIVFRRAYADWTRFAPATQRLHDHGVLNLLRGMVGGGDALIGAVAAAMDTPESIRAIRNFLLLTKFFACIPPDVLNSLADTVNSGAKREKAHKAPGLLHLLWRLRNEDSRHAVSIGLDLLEGLGKGL